ncbi:MAG: alpha/beta fold hydrolase [Actinomycetes bacterium]
MTLTQMDQVQTISVHGHQRAFLKAGSGPAVLLIHGIGSRHETWLPIISRLAQHYTVVAPDLLGHGQSGKPRADYSAGGYANGMRDLLSLLGIEKATIVGHSLGGGIAMQFAYQFPHRAERLVLVGSGGLGPEVNPVIPLCTLPGAGLGLSVLTLPPIRAVGHALLGAMHKSGLPYTADARELSIVYEGLGTRENRVAFQHVVRALIDWRGQIATMRDRAYLAEYIPALIIWGKRDTVVPVRHAHVAHELLPGSRLEIFKNAGHFPHADEPEMFSDALMDFMQTTIPASFSERAWTQALQRGAHSAHPLFLPEHDGLAAES